MALGSRGDPKIPFREVITTLLDLSDHPEGMLIPRKKVIISNTKLPANNLNSFSRVTSSHEELVCTYHYILQKLSPY